MRSTIAVCQMEMLEGLDKSGGQRIQVQLDGGVLVCRALLHVHEAASASKHGDIPSGLHHYGAALESSHDMRSTPAWLYSVDAADKAFMDAPRDEHQGFERELVVS
jgi:hypothetical protein